MSDENSSDSVYIVEFNLDNINSPLAELVNLTKQVVDDTPKALEGNKQAARRARKALNEVKKICTPMRISIQEAIKTKSE